MVEQSRETPAAHRSGEPVATKLLRIEAKARQEHGLKFVNLYYLMNEELLLRCFKQLKENKAAGIDKVTKEQYAEKLEANLEDLVNRLQRMAYRPQPVRRVYIPKAASHKQRPFNRIRPREDDWRWLLRTHSRLAAHDNKPENQSNDKKTQ